MGLELVLRALGLAISADEDYLKAKRLQKGRDFGRYARTDNERRHSHL
jgi:hypothetical protein